MRHLLCALTVLAMFTTAVSASGPQATLTVDVVPAAPLLPSDRDASANWKMAGLLSLGGIPNRTSGQVCATVSPSGGDDTNNIQTAINNCGTCPTYSSSVSCVVSLAAGTFTVSGSVININKSVVVRGAGAGVTILNRTNGAVLNSYNPISYTSIFHLGGGYSVGSAQQLAADAAKGAYGITLGSTPSGISVGTLVNVDELALGQPMPDCCVGTGDGATVSVWAEPDYKVEWNAHNPAAPGGLDSACYNNTFSRCGHTDATGYSIRAGGVSEEYHLVTGVGATQCAATVPGATANTICFDSPLTWTYRTANSGAVEVFSNIVQFAGVENLTMQMGGDGNLQFQGCVYCWAKGVESYHYFNPGIHFEQGAFRDQLEDYWAHNGAWPVNGGGGYSITLTYGSSEDYIVNGVSMLANKVIVMRASGAGTVVAYNYMDDGYISNNAGWVETGLNCSHMSGGHHALFEGNRAFNVDSDFTHGASTYCTYFRNHITGVRATFTGEFDGVTRNDSTGCCSPMRALASHPYTYWTSFLGNVAGLAGVTTSANGWVYSDNGSVGGNSGNPSMLKLGWDDFNTNPRSTKDDVANTIYPAAAVGSGPTYATASVCNALTDPCQTIVDGNYDYVTNSVHWATNDTAHTLPSSLYLSAPPVFFGSTTWPPVDPITPAINAIPAYARWLACQPNPTAPCVIGTGTPTIVGVALAGGTASNYLSGAISGTPVGAIGVTMGDASAFDGTLSKSGANQADFDLSSSTLPSNLTTNGSTPACTVKTTYNLNIIATPGPGEQRSALTQAVTVTCDPTTSTFVSTTNVTLSNSDRSATNGTTTGNDIQVDDFLHATGISGQKVYYEMGCAGNNGGIGNGGAGYANAPLIDWLGKDSNSAGYVLGNGGTTYNYQAGNVYTAGAWSGCVAGDTIGMLLDATVTPMTLAVRVLHSGAWGALSTARNVPSGLTASGTLIPTADVKATGEAYTICGNPGCEATPSGLPGGYVWFDTVAH